MNPLNDTITATTLNAWNNPVHLDASQPSLWFHGENAGTALPTAQELDEAIDPTHPCSPLAGYIGNADAVRRVSIAARAALAEPDHCAAELNFAFVGGPSTGKTYLAKLYAQLLGLPFVEVQPKAVKTPEDLVTKIDNVLARVEFEDGDTLALRPDPIAGDHLIPPCVVFIDEVHALDDNLVQALLKATEQDDRVLETSQGIFDFGNVAWIIATTDRGLLFDAFDTRFEKVQLRAHTIEERSKIVTLRFPDLPPAACSLIARFGGDTLREVLGFAREARLVASAMAGAAGRDVTDPRGGDTVLGEAQWMAVVQSVAESRGIDEFGMDRNRVATLAALEGRAVAKARLPGMVGVKVEEMERFILPPMLSAVGERGPMVEVTGRGYGLTDEGRRQLILRRQKVQRAA